MRSIGQIWSLNFSSMISTWNNIICIQLEARKYLGFIRSKIFRGSVSLVMGTVPRRCQWLYLKGSTESDKMLTQPCAGSEITLWAWRGLYFRNILLNISLLKVYRKSTCSTSSIHLWSKSIRESYFWLKSEKKIFLVVKGVGLK